MTVTHGYSTRPTSTDNNPGHRRSGFPTSHAGYPSSSLHDDLGRVRRVKAKPLRGRFASPDTAPTAKGDGSCDKDGEDQDAAEKHAPSSNSSSNAAELSRTASH